MLARPRNLGTQNVFLVVPALALAFPNVRADEPGAPRAVAAWAAGPFEARVAFDRAVPTQVARDLVGRSIAYDETRPTRGTRPSAPAPADKRGQIRVAAARLDDGGRTLVLTTDPHPRAATYTLDVPGVPVRVEYDLSGVEVTWEGDGEKAPAPWSGWWPTPDPAEAAEALAGSAGHDRGFALLRQPGKLSVATMLAFPSAPLVVRVAANGPVEATLGGEEPAENDKAGGATFRLQATGEPTLLLVSVPTGVDGKNFTLKIAYTVCDKTETNVQTDRTLLAWVPPASPSEDAPIETPDLAGGDPAKGAAVFASDEAKCVNCHKARGRGGTVGPDLDDQAGRDPKTVYRDVFAPSARVHPDYVAYTLGLKDGRVLVGMVRAEGADAVRVVDTEAKVTVVPRDQIEDFRASATSIMPVGLAGALGEAKMRDLIAYLTAPAPR